MAPLRYSPGERFARMVLVEPVGKGRWTARCDCGEIRTLPAYALRSGNTRSCGCLQKERRGAGSLRHGYGRMGTARRSEYSAWRNMIGRCYDPKVDRYPEYGGRGITVCDRWRHSFENFIADVGDKPTPEHTLDREDTNGHYEPTNVRWATRTQQSRNRRTARMVQYQGEAMCLSEACERAGVPYSRARHRLKAGRSIEEALTA